MRLFTHTAVASSWICMWAAFWAASESLDFSDQWLPVDRRLSALQRPPCPNALHILSNSQGGGHKQISVHNPLASHFQMSFFYQKNGSTVHSYTQICMHSGWAEVFSLWWSSESERDAFHYSVRQTKKDKRQPVQKKEKRKEDLREKLRRAKEGRKWTLSKNQDLLL